MLVFVTLVGVLTLIRLYIVIPHPVKKLRVIRENPNINFLHIPKTAGVSFYTEMKHLIKFSDTSPGRNEKCYYYIKVKRPPQYPMVTFLREPVKHVLSQYVFCRYSAWGKSVTGRYWDSYPDDMYEGFEKWLEDYESPQWRKTQCYFPYNLQTRFLTCTQERGHYYNNLQYYDSDWAFANLMSMEGGYGLTEYYPESLCLIMFTLEMEIPKWCDCNFRDQYVKVHYSHDVPRHSVEMISPKALTTVNEMTVHDHHLYNRAVEVFKARLAAMEGDLGFKVFCNYI